MLDHSGRIDKFMLVPFCFFNFLMMMTVPAFAVTWYVSPGGSDRWSGKLAAANLDKSDGPFATLSRARDVMRKLKSEQGFKEPVTVMVRGGRYYLDRTIVFTAEDSGTSEFPIIYQAYPGEKPILSGGRKVTGWKSYEGKILQAALPGARGGKWKSRQLFLNGLRQVRARTPNLDPSDPMYGGWAFVEGPPEKLSSTAFQYKAGSFPHHWSRPSEGEVNFYQGGWGSWRSTVPILSVNEEDDSITLVRPGMQFDLAPWYYPPVPFSPGNAYYLENLLEELDQPGEWCLDSEDGLLYFWPPAGSLKPSDEIVLPMLDCLVDIQGASWLQFSGFTFTETRDGDNYHHEGVEGAGPMFPRPGLHYGGDALHLKGAENCTIQRNHFDAVGCNAIYLEGHNYRNVVHENEIGFPGANGICLLGTKLMHPLFNEISDNFIHHVGVLNKYVAGVFTGMSDGNIIRHNRIEFVPHHAVNLGNNPSGRNIVEYNLIRYSCLEIADTAAINMWMEEVAKKDAERDGQVIRYNMILDTFSFQAANGKVGKELGFSSAIYLDNYSSNCLIHGNIIVRAQTGVLVHAGKNNLIENNVLVDCRTNVRFQDLVTLVQGKGFYKAMGGFMTGNYLAHNIFYQSDLSAVLYTLDSGWTDRTVLKSEGNLYFQKGNGQYLIQYTRDVSNLVKSSSLVEWQKQGYDRDSLTGDPLFDDSTQDDYRLKADSPAFKLGFVPIETTKIGPRVLWGSSWKSP